MKANPIDKLLAISDLVRVTDPALADWLADGVWDHVEGCGALDDLLGLNSGRSGHRSARYEFLVARRNAHFRAALDDLHTPAALAREIRRFQDVSPADREGLAPPATWPSWRREIWRAAKTGLQLPATLKGLAKALESGH